MLGGAAAWARTAAAQSTAQPKLIGWLYPQSGPEQASRRLEAFRRRMVELGYREGSEYRLVVRYTSPTDLDVVRRDGAELLALGPALVMAGANVTALAMHQLTASVPVVFIGFFGDPIAPGFAASYAHPGGNMTGVLFASDPAVLGKEFALLKEMAPGIARVDALLGNANPAIPGIVAETGAKLGLAVRISVVANGEDLRAHLASADAPPDAYFFATTPLFLAMRNEIVALVDRARRPAVFPFRELVDAGGLMSYGADIDGMYSASADYAAKILGGAAPADLPIDAPAVYMLVINRKTAKAQGIVVPPALLARADELIE